MNLNPGFSDWASMVPETQNPDDERLCEMLDKNAISEAVMRYFIGVDRADAELVGSTYHPDAVDVRGDRRIDGATAGADIVASNAAAMVSTRHHVTTQMVEVDGDTAHVETYCLGVHVTGGDRPQRRMQTAGRYLDEFERRNGSWRIVRRRVLIDRLYISPLEDEAGGRP